MLGRCRYIIIKKCVPCQRTVPIPTYRSSTFVPYPYQRTVPVPTYRTRTNVLYPYHYKKQKGVPYFLAKIGAYRTYVPYRTAILDCKLGELIKDSYSFFTESLNESKTKSMVSFKSMVSTCGPRPIGGPQRFFAVGHRSFWFEKDVFARWAVHSLTLSERLQKVAVNVELTCFLQYC